ncbi:MAG: UDP-2,3-diacylglucosamine diphosphatase LpxI [Pseudomonadota bacterium]
MTDTGERIGVIAGSGDLPVIVARCLADAGRDTYVAALKNAADPSLENEAWETGWYELYSLQGLLEGLKLAGVSKVVLAGKVGHGEVFSTSKFDGLLMDFLQKLKDHRPSTLLGGLVDLLAGNGLPVVPLTDIAPELMPAAGHVAGPALRREQSADLELGWRIARGIADLDIGQTAIVKGGAVVAVEAMEGTDLAIERAGIISRGGLTAVKLAASDHDLRYDVPTVGVDTIENLIEAGCSLLAIEADRSIMLSADRVTELCESAGITLLACREAQDGSVHCPETL